MGKRDRRRKREERAAFGPPVHVEVIAPVDLRGLVDLIKPAVLYADRVTIHSPAAALLSGVTEFAELSDPADQLAAIVEIARQAPTMFSLDIDPATASSLDGLLRMSEPQKAALRRATGAGDELRELDEMIAGISQMWDEQMPGVVDQIIETTGSGALLSAIRSGAVQVAPISEQTPTDYVSQAPTAAGGRGVDPMFDGFLETIVEIVSAEGGTFPLLDTDAAGLIQSMERESLLVFGEPTATRSSEVDAAARFMAYLPYFSELSLDEIIDLRKEIGAPLVRFRSEMVKLSVDFSRPIDASFAVDVEHAWRERVDPALTEIRETLAEHGLLREVAAVARGDAGRMLTEAGGVIAASHHNLLNLSGLVTAGAAVAIPALDTLGKSVNERMRAHSDIQNQGFYFLHKVAENARRA